MPADESSTPRHGGSATGGRHSASRMDRDEAERLIDELLEEAEAEQVSAKPAVTEPSAVADASPGLTPISAPQGNADGFSAVGLVDGDQELQMGDAPTPIGVDPETSHSFARIGAGQGARVTTRANVGENAPFRHVEAVRMSRGRPHVERHEVAVESNTRVFAMIAAGVVLVAVLVGWLLMRALVSVEEPTETVVAEQMQVDVGESLEYRGVTYTLEQQDDGAYALKSTNEDQEGSTTVCTLRGTPVALILYNTAFIIPENLGDGTWDLVAHHLGGGSITQQVTGPDGSALIGTGEIKTAKLVGSTIAIETTTGESQSVALE